MSRREQTEMSGSEVHDFLAHEKVVVVSTFGPRGWPHSMPLWYVLREPEAEAVFPPASGGVELWSWTYRKSQKVRNLERDPRATLLVEAGGGIYNELRGVMIEAEAVIHHDEATRIDLGRELALRYSQGPTLPEEADRFARTHSVKRVALEFRPLRVVTWDFRKLS